MGGDPSNAKILKWGEGGGVDTPLQAMHHLDNNATKKLKCVYSRCVFDCNQLDL